MGDILHFLETPSSICGAQPRKRAFNSAMATARATDTAELKYLDGERLLYFIAALESILASIGGVVSELPISQEKCQLQLQEKEIKSQIDHAKMLVADV
jgi:hypothetical protein